MPPKAKHRWRTRLPRYVLPQSYFVGYLLVQFTGGYGVLIEYDESVSTKLGF